MPKMIAERTLGPSALSMRTHSNLITSPSPTAGRHDLGWDGQPFEIDDDYGDYDEDEYEYEDDGWAEEAGGEVRPAEEEASSNRIASSSGAPPACEAPSAPLLGFAACGARPHLHHAWGAARVDDGAVSGGRGTMWMWVGEGGRASAWRRVHEARTEKFVSGVTNFFRHTSFRNA